MARFFGKVGYAATVEDPAGSGVYKKQTVEFDYQGDVIRNSRQLEDGEKVNNDISLGNSISVVADEFAVANFRDIKYVVWMGERWTVTTVEVRAPRLILSLGGVYNGPEVATPSTP